MIRAMLLAVAFPVVFAFAAEKPSVLFINVDDWNDWNEVLQGHPQAITPHIARLAKRGVTFSNAICASPSCDPSRPALFTGIAPARSGNISNDSGKHPWRFYAGPDAVTNQAAFRENAVQFIDLGCITPVKRAKRSQCRHEETPVDWFMRISFSGGE